MDTSKAQFILNDVLNITRKINTATDSGDWIAVARYDQERAHMLQNLNTESIMASSQGVIEELLHLDKNILSVVQNKRQELAETISEVSDRKKIEQAYST